MSQAVRPLEHADAEKKDDATLAKEARDALSNAPAQQFVSELMTKLRALDVPWWSPEKLRLRWPAQDRMRWLRTRADIRQGITNQLTGLAKNAARKKSPDFQASLIDSVIDEGDVTAAIFEESFDPTELVLYGPADAFYRAFMDSMPWDQDTATNQEFATWLLECALSDKCTIDLTVGGAKERPTRKPILQPLDVRSSIDARVWHTRMPLEVRVAIDEARLKRERERPNDAFNANGEVAIATPAIIAANVPLRDLMPVFLAAERAMGFGGNASPSKPRAESSKSESKSEVAPPREAAPSSIASSARASVRPPPPAEPPAEAKPLLSEAPEGSWSLPPAASRSATPPPFPAASSSVTPPPLPANNRASVPPAKSTPSVPPASVKAEAKNGDAKAKRGEPKVDANLDKVARGAVQGMLENVSEPITNDDQLETTNPWLTNQASDDGFDELDALLPPADADPRSKKKHGKS